MRGTDPTEELVVVHADAFTVEATRKAGSVGVDAGCAGVFDDACPSIDLDHGIEEGICFDLGAVAFSGHGDGGYPFYTGKLGDQVAKIRLGFIGRAYSAKLHFKVGEAIEHPKFGIGTVTSARDNKVEVTFADGPRTLIHAKS